MCEDKRVFFSPQDAKTDHNNYRENNDSFPKNFKIKKK